MKSRRLLALAVVATSAMAGCYGTVGEYYDDGYPYVSYASPYYYDSYYARPYGTYPYYSRPYYDGSRYRGGYYSRPYYDNRYRGGYHARPHYDGNRYRGGYSRPHDRGSYRGAPPSAPRVHHGDPRSAPGGVSVQRSPRR